MAENLSGIRLISRLDNDDDEKTCIICHKTGGTLVGTDNGRQCVKRAASIRQDIVVKRLKSDSERFVYHVTNNCYKSYTLSKTLDRIARENYKAEHRSEENENVIKPSDWTFRTSRGSIPSRAPPSSQQDQKDLPCVICGYVKTRMGQHEVRKKFRICEEESACKFIEATHHLQDEVYTRVPDLTTPEKLYAADIFYHDKCMKSYLRKYEQTKRDGDVPKMTQVNLKQVLFTRATSHLDLLLEKGHCFTVTEVKDFMLSLLEEGDELNSNLLGRDVKQILISHYGEAIQFAANPRRNESDLIFSSSITPTEIAVKIKNQDVMREAGILLRLLMQEVDFGLGDRFCDAAELRESWQKNLMPDGLLSFFSSLYNIPKSRMFKSSASGIDRLHEEEQVELDHGHENQSIENEGETWSTLNKLHCLFQIMYYSLFHGRRKTPLHVMLGHTVYGKSRSRELLTILNRVGVSTSYNEVRSARNLLAGYAVHSSKPGETPIPSHFTRDDFTMVAFDNADYSDRSSLSGKDSLHYTASCVFQDGINRPLGKPTVSSTGLHYRQQIFEQRLPCQVVPTHPKRVVRPSLPSELLLRENALITLLNNQRARATAGNVEFLITFLRCGLPPSSPVSSNLPPWAGIHALISSTHVPLMRVGFLPVIPRPITEYATVRKALTNFQSVRRQVNQQVIPVWSDEGVFRHVADIIMSEPDTFSDIVPLMGPFHWTKILLRCAGSFLTGSGMDDALVECEVFGRMVLQSVLSGGHYVRSLQGMLIVDEVLKTLMWRAFWESCASVDSAAPIIADAVKVKNDLAGKKQSEADFSQLLVKLQGHDLVSQFNEFQLECETRSELCRYFSVFIKVVQIIKNIVAADREGNWDLHVASISDSMPIFREFDALNYLRFGSWYLAQIEVLEVKHPWLYHRFSMGQWVVQERSGRLFSAVGADMKLEQTIQRSSKGPGGHNIVGQSKSTSLVSEFELLFHEIVEISNLMNTLTDKHLMEHTECQVQHSLVGNKGLIFDQNVSRLLDFVLARQNPYLLTISVPLHNFITKHVTDTTVTGRLLCALENGEKFFREYWKERFILKRRKLTDTISKRKLPRFDTSFEQSPFVVVKEAVSSKQVAVAQRNIEIAKERGIGIAEILSHDLIPISPLFDGDLPKKADKSKLLDEIEPSLNLNLWNRESPLRTHVILDFMSKIRQMPVSKCATMGEAVTTTVFSAMRVCQEPDLLHIIFDSYLEHSLKEGERLRRTDVKQIDMVTITKDTPIPQQLNKFWGSPTNKQNLQLLARDIVMTLGGGDILVSSVVNNDEVLPSKLYQASNVNEISALSSWIEEADARIILHVDWAVRVEGCERIVVVSNDTDTVALLLHYIPDLQSLGLKELWQQFGTGEKRRMLPLHQAVSKLGNTLAKVVIKAHILTGTDCMSKIGSKHAAMECNPIGYLTNFGESNVLSEQDEILAEQFLVRVWAGVKSKTSAQTFDELRFECYISMNRAIDELPPTSSVVHAHIYRAAFLVRQACRLLNGESMRGDYLDAVNHSWEERFGMLLPIKNLRPLPPNILGICHCGSKCEVRCRCKNDAVICVVFCHKKEHSCTNT